MLYLAAALAGHGISAVDFAQDEHSSGGADFAGTEDWNAPPCRPAVRDDRNTGDRRQADHWPGASVGSFVRPSAGHMGASAPINANVGTSAPLAVRVAAALFSLNGDAAAEADEHTMNGCSEDAPEPWPSQLWIMRTATPQTQLTRSLASEAALTDVLKNATAI